MSTKQTTRELKDLINKFQLALRESPELSVKHEKLILKAIKIKNQKEAAND